MLDGSLLRTDAGAGHGAVSSDECVKHKEMLRERVRRCRDLQA